MFLNLLNKTVSKHASIYYTETANLLLLGGLKCVGISQSNVKNQQ